MRTIQWVCDPASARVYEMGVAHRSFAVLLGRIE